MTTRINSIKILFMASFLLAMSMIIASCKKEVDPASTAVQLLSFGPTGAMHGDTLRFIGRNLGKVNEIQFVGATVSRADFIAPTNELIRVIAPKGAEAGRVTLKTTEGDVVSLTIINFNTLVEITSMTKEARPGTNIVIKGKFLNWIEGITFARDIAETTFVSQSFDQLVVKVPDNAQSGTLFYLVGGTEPVTAETDSVLIVTLPVISAMAPNPALHAGTLTITGTNLDLTKKILFTGNATPITTFASQTATEIKVVIPASAKKGKVTVVAASGVSTQSAGDLDLTLPAITNLAPNPIDTGANLTITGTDLNLVSGVSFTGVTGAVTAFVSQSATQLVVKVPAGTLKGKVTLAVKNSTLTVESPQVLDIKGGLPPLAAFAHAIYTDALQNGFQNWSWAGNDFNSTAIVREGTKSIKATYGAGGYEGITFHNDAGPATAGYTTFEFSLFGEAGTAGKTMNIVVNGNWGGPKTVTIVGGEWTTYSISIADMGSPAQLKEIVLQSAGFSGVVHIDHVGLR
jgi:hypothetical protein